MSAPAKTNELDPLLHPAQGGQASRRLAVVVGQVPPERHRTALHQGWARRPVRHVRRARVHPEPAAHLHE
jgi:hypothetical protein